MCKSAVYCQMLLAVAVSGVGIGASHAQTTAPERGLAEERSVTVRAQALARQANEVFDRFLRGREPRAQGDGEASSNSRSDATRDIESGSDWIVRVRRDYNAVMDRLSVPTVPNPVADAARRQAAERDAWLKGRRDHDRRTTVTDPASGRVVEVRPSEGDRSPDAPGEGVVGWLNRGYERYRDEVAGKLAAAPSDGTKQAAGKPSTDPDRSPDAPAVNIAQAGEKADAPPTPAASSGDAQKMEGARKAEAERQAAEAKAAEDARKVEAERQAAETARQAQVEREAEEARKAEALRKAEAERKAAAAAREAEVKAAEEARKAEAVRRAEAERQAAEAARLAEAKAAEEARKVEAARKADADRSASGAPAKPAPNSSAKAGAAGETRTPRDRAARGQSSARGGREAGRERASPTGWSAGTASAPGSRDRLMPIARPGPIARPAP